MDKLDCTSNSSSLQQVISFGADQLRRRKRLEAIIDHGLPPFPHTVLELTAILSNSTVDVKKAGKVIRADPSLSAQVLRLCNSPMFGLRSRVISIEQATILIGTDRLRSLAMTCSLVDYSGHGLPRDQIMNFWQHSFLAALLSEQLAVHTDYCEKEQAYIAGLLHDIGQLPQWMLTTEEKAERRTIPPMGWTDNTPIEREHFGMDHCEIGSCMAVTWNFMPSFIDVLSFHHYPTEAQHDPDLVSIVSTIERFLHTKVKAASTGTEPTSEIAEDEPGSFINSLSTNGSHVAEFDSGPVVEMLNKEYDRLLPLVDLGLTNTISAFR